MSTSNPLELNEYELFLFVSPEQRCYFGLESMSTAPPPQKAWINEFIDYDTTLAPDIAVSDITATANYYQNLIKLNQLLKQREVTVIQHNRHRLNYLEPFDISLGTPCPFLAPIVVDISCAPRGHLLSLLNYLARCQQVNNQRVVLMYSLVQKQSSSEESYSYGMQDVAVVPGYSGRIRHKKDVLIMVLGFEGNRAFSLYRRLIPFKTYLILGDTKEVYDRDFYLTQARRNNYALLNNPTSEELVMASRSPSSFYNEFLTFLNKEILPLSEDFNISFSCLGTKLQTVGAFLALKQHPYIQVVDSLPTRRRIASEGKKQTIFADLGRKGLLEPESINWNQNLSF